MADLFIGNRMGASVPSKIDISSATVTLTPSSFVYDGTNKTQGVSSVVVNGVTLTAGTDYTITNNVQTNAGTYTLSIMGTGNYEGTVTADWSIAKAAGSISVNPTSMSIVGAGNTDTATLTVVGDGAISVGTSASGVATASRSGSTVTVTSVGSGSATITVTLAAGSNYTGGSATISVVVAVPSSTLADNSPATIQAVAQAGTAASVWSVGARTAAINFQNVTVGALSFNGLSACAFILGFDHNSSKEGTGIHFQFGMNTSGTKIAFCDSNYNSNSGGFIMNPYASDSGWKNSVMYNTCTRFLTALPTTWQNVIATTTKYTDNVGGSSNAASNVTTTSDKIWLLAEFEVFGTRTLANSAEQNYQMQYDYYKNGNFKLFYKHNDTTTACIWWLRSHRFNYSGEFCSVSTYGNANAGSAHYSYGFAPGFKIA